ncbi:MAG: MBL fold metallo-hydrolase [Candidatus Caccovivens sp.]
MINITWYGTATIMLDINGEKLLFDPFFRRNKKLEQPALEEFCNVDYIFNTHPHFDHLCDLPTILEKSNAHLYGTPTAYMRLETQGVDVENKVEILCPHESLKTKHSEVKLYRTKHVVNDFGIVLKTALRTIFKCKIHKAVEILSLHNDFRMGGDIVAYEICAENKKILIFGSAGFDESIDLPKNVDVLIWPFQGRSNMTKYSLPIIEKLAPKKIILDHFDDAFPPITGHIDTSHFVKVMKEKHPEIEVIVPEYKRSLVL